MLERRNPIPPGRYWLDVFRAGMPAWAAWASGNRSSVKVVSTEHWEPELFGNSVEHDWILFDVVSPTVWDPKIQGTALGFPTVVKQSPTDSKSGAGVDTGVKTREDTVSRGVDSSSSLPLLLLLGGAFIAFAVFNSKRN